MFVRFIYFLLGIAVFSVGVYTVFSHIYPTYNWLALAAGVLLMLRAWDVRAS